MSFRCSLSNVQDHLVVSFGRAWFAGGMERCTLCVHHFVDSDRPLVKRAAVMTGSFQVSGSFSPEMSPWNSSDKDSAINYLV